MAKRAPKFYRVAGLEWLHRLMADPIGHADRVFIQSFPLIPLMLRARFRKP
jgi:N-acetylglucosaminyldiphosphoundecaprenol N-acetyl-beta-D-mannosaminyltransferase